MGDKTPMRGQYVFIMAKSRSFTFYFFSYYSEDSVTYLLDMVVLITLEGTLTQTRLRIGRLLYLIRGHEGANILELFYGKIPKFL